MVTDPESPVVHLLPSLRFFTSLVLIVFGCQGFFLSHVFINVQQRSEIDNSPTASKNVYNNE